MGFGRKGTRQTTSPLRFFENQDGRKEGSTPNINNADYY
jgi:hypothetical protein